MRVVVSPERDGVIRLMQQAGERCAPRARAKHGDFHFAASGIGAFRPMRPSVPLSRRWIFFLWLMMAMVPSAVVTSFSSRLWLSGLDQTAADKAIAAAMDAMET